MMEHTKEPWHVEKICEANYEIFHDHGTNQIEVTATTITEANARHIVACVNALANVSTEWLEENKSIVVLGAPIADRFREAKEEITRLTKKNATLLELQNILILCGEPECKDVTGYPEKLRALIRGLVTAKRQRDELVAVLREVLCTHDYHGDDGQVAADKACEALAKVKGES